MNDDIREASVKRADPALHSRKITEVPLTFVDVETTGLSPRDGDRVCEIALIRREPGVRERIFSSLIDPKRAISPGAYRVNRITAKMLKGAPMFRANRVMMSDSF